MVTTARSAWQDLRDVLGDDRLVEAADADAVAGMRPRWVARVSETEQVAAAMRVAAEHEIRVLPRGSGSKLDWGGRPDNCELVLDLSQASGVLEHAAGDLVLRAKTGTSLAEAQRTVAQSGQQLSIEHPYPDATLGGVIATGLAGPSRHLHGGVRDLLIGITVVRADGTVTTAGGKVVKNVAGYDLGKLYTGSYGTLGVITEAIFRLHPLAAERRWVSLTVDTAEAAADAVSRLRRSKAVPTAIELDRPRVAGPISVVAEFEGSAEATRQRCGELAEQLGAEPGVRVGVEAQPPSWWAHLPFDARRDTGLRLGVKPAELAALLDAAEHQADRAGIEMSIRGAAGLGVLYAGVPDRTDPAGVAAVVEGLRATTDKDGYTAVLRAAPTAADAFDPSPAMPAALRTLMRRTKDQFDPARRLAPGRIIGGLQ